MLLDNLMQRVAYREHIHTIGNIIPVELDEEIAELKHVIDLKMRGVNLK